jgi:hypothetical protein
MATTRSTSRWRGHRIRRKKATPEATFVVFLFHFHLFTMNVTRALPLEAIKGEAGVTSRGREQIDRID